MERKRRGTVPSGRDEDLPPRARRQDIPIRLIRAPTKRERAEQERSDKRRGEERQGPVLLPLSQIKGGTGRHPEDLGRRVPQSSSRSVPPPILVRRMRGTRRYQVLLGHAVLDHTVLGGDEQIAAVVLDETPLDLRVVALLDPEARGRGLLPMAPLEEAETLVAVMRIARLTQAQLAVLLDRSQVWVSQAIALTSLPKGIKGALRDPRIATNVTRSTLVEVVQERGWAARMRLWRRILRGATIRDVRQIKRADRGAVEEK